MSRNHCTIFRSVFPVTIGMELIVLHGTEDKELLAYLVKTEQIYVAKLYEIHSMRVVKQRLC